MNRNQTAPHWHNARLSDQQLLLWIGQDLQRLYADILKEPLPDDIEALLKRIGRVEPERTRPER
jgi:hypothetical protein